MENGSSSQKDMRVKAVRRDSTSLVIREMKIKTTRFFQWGLSCKIKIVKGVEKKAPNTLLGTQNWIYRFK